MYNENDILKNNDIKRKEQIENFFKHDKNKKFQPSKFFLDDFILIISILIMFVLFSITQIQLKERKELLNQIEVLKKETLKVNKQNNIVKYQNKLLIEKQRISNFKIDSTYLHQEKIISDSLYKEMQNFNNKQSINNNILSKY